MAETTEQITPEPEPIKVQNRVKEFIRNKSGSPSQAEVKERLDYYRSLPKEDQLKESEKLFTALSSMAKEGVPEYMGKPFAVLEGVGQDLDLMTKLSLVNAGLYNRLNKLEERKRLEYQQDISELPSSATKAQVVERYQEIESRLRNFLSPYKDEVREGLYLVGELAAKETLVKTPK
jgi:hypothetical protein